MAQRDHFVRTRDYDAMYQFLREKIFKNMSKRAAEMIEIGDVVVSTLGNDDNENCPASTLYYQQKSQ